MRFTPFRIALIISGLALILLAAVAWNLHPKYLTREINKRLAQIPEYHGEVQRAEINPLTGNLTITGLRLHKNKKTAPAGFGSAEKIVVQFSWRALLKRQYLLAVHVEKPVTRFLMRQRKPGQPRKVALWQPFFAKLPPFRMNRVTISDGSLRVRNDEDIPPTDLFFDQINLEGTNFTNRESLLLPSPVKVSGTGRMMNEAPLTLEVEAVPFKEHATFTLKGKLERFNLTRLNPVLRNYTGVDIEKGFTSVDASFSVEGQNFKGRVHRTSEELIILGKTDGHLPFIQGLKEVMFEKWLNRRKDKEGNLEADYDVTGPLGYMDQDIFLAAVWVAKTAFLQSLRPTLPETVTMGMPEQAEEDWMALQARERKKAAAHSRR